MKVFEPHVSVKLVKASPRTDLVDGMPVASERYGDLKAIDLTPFLGEVGGVRTSKSVREVSGGFSITLADKAFGASDAKLETLYALIEPMDLIEIRFCRDPSKYEGGLPPVVMRGLVSEVVRNETISGGQPQRSVTVEGQDFGKILQIIQIFYLNNSVVGENVLSELAFFHKYGTASDAKIKPANEFLAEVVEKVVNPYLAALVGLSDGTSIGAKVVNKWEVKSSVEGSISPYAVASFNNVPLSGMLEQLLDVGPFNELYVEDTEEGIQLTGRPAPFLDAKGEPIQGAAETITADIDEVVAMGVTRTDAGTANYYWVIDNRWTLMNNEDANLAAQSGPQENYVLFEYLNSQSRLYGFRKMEVQTMLGPPEFSNSDAVTAEQLPENVNALGAWLDKRRKILADCNKDNVLFEHGSIRLRGNEKIKAGQRLVLTRGNGVSISFYIVRVDHDFQPMQGFLSTLMVERGTGFIERAKSASSLYFTEMKLGGVQ